MSFVRQTANIEEADATSPCTRCVTETLRSTQGIIRICSRPSSAYGRPIDRLCTTVCSDVVCLTTSALITTKKKIERRLEVELTYTVLEIDCYMHIRVCNKCPLAVESLRGPPHPDYTAHADLSMSKHAPLCRSRACSSLFASPPPTQVVVPSAR